MTARLVLPPGAPEEVWLAERRKGVTASEIAVVLGISPFDSAFNLYWAKRGEIEAEPDNAVLSLGRHLEPWIADRWADQHREFLLLLGGLYAHESRPWQLATPDRLLVESAGEPEPAAPQAAEAVAVLEIKTSGSYEEWGEDGTDEIPVYYRAQVLWQLDVLGLDTAYVACLFLSSRTIRTYVIERDETELTLMRAEALAFLNRPEPPAIDAHDATRAALTALWPKVEDEETEVPRGVAQAYRLAVENLAAAKAAKALAENQLRDAMGPAKYAVDPDGTKVATRSRYTVAEHLRRACDVDKLVPARAKGGGDS